VSTSDNKSGLFAWYSNESLCVPTNKKLIPNKSKQKPGRCIENVNNKKYQICRNRNFFPNNFKIKTQMTKDLNWKEIATIIRLLQIYKVAGYFSVSDLVLKK